MLLPRPGKRLGIAPSFPQIWALSPGLPTDWALPPDTGDCPRGPAHLQQRPPPHSSRSLARLLARPRTQLPASSLQLCGELPAASAAPASFLVRPATVPPGLAPASGSRRGHQDGARKPAEGLRLGGRARRDLVPRNLRRFRLLFQRSQSWGRRLGGPEEGRAGRWVGGTPRRGAPRSGGAAPPSPRVRGLGEVRGERGRSD